MSAANMSTPTVCVRCFICLSLTHPSLLPLVLYSGG
jgi:hypothetical protein